MQINFRRLDKELPTPSHAHAGDGGVDLYARHDVELVPGAWSSVPTGVEVEIPLGFAGLILPRSGLAAKHGIGVVNGPGLIDSGYRGEVKVLLINHGSEIVRLSRGERVAQMVVVAVSVQDWVEVPALSPTVRGEGGFGSTGS